MLIRPLEEADILQASAIVGKNYSPEYGVSSAAELREMFGTAIIKPNYVVAEEDGRILGFAGFMQSWMDYNIYTVFWVNVNPNRQRKGIGKQLVQWVIEEIRNHDGSRLILLTTDSPSYYETHFGFKALQAFMDGTYQLMSLSLEEQSSYKSGTEVDSA